jgi:uncharacterized membrane protein (DUF4010 family)
VDLNVGGQFELLPLWKVALALGLGLLIGAERQRARKDVGLRTFALTCLAGTLGALISQSIALAVLGLVAVIIVVFNIQELMRGQPVQATTSVALFVTALIGMLVAGNQVAVPVAAAILVTLLLAWREELVGFTLGLTEQEVRAALYLGILTFVVYPLLPQGFVDPEQLVNPRAVWITVILIAVIGFANYILLRLYGSRGLAITGFLGGVVNSTATVTQLATVQRTGGGQMTEAALRGVLFANAAMFLRNELILVLFAPAVALRTAVPLGCAVIASLLVAFARRGSRPTAVDRIDLASPFSVASVLRFGLVFLGVTVASVIAQRAFGQSGFFAVSFAAGVASSASATATAATLASLGAVTISAAALGALLTSLASVMVHPILVWRFSGDRTFTRLVAAGTGFAVLAGVVGALFGVSLGGASI